MPTLTPNTLRAAVAIALAAAAITVGVSVATDDDATPDGRTAQVVGSDD